MADLPQPGGEQRSQTKFIVFENFEKMDTQSSRLGLSEKSLAFIENLQFISPNTLVTVPASAVAAFATITENFVLGFFASIGGNDYVFGFTSQGSGYFINLATGNVGQFAPDNTFSANPDLTVWQASRVLINDSIAGYCTFDGSVFVQQGGVSPNIVVTNGGTGYSPSSPPSVTISGGSGSGATAVAIVSPAGVITAIQLTNPGHGYKAGDSLTVTIGASPGSGAAGHVTMTGAAVSALLLQNGGGFVTPAGPFAQLSFSGGGGSGARGYAVIGTSGGGGHFVSSVVLTSPGENYTSAPTVTLSVNPGGIAPIITAPIGTESVATIVLDAGGTGYLAIPSVTITPSNGLGSGAAAVATLSGTSVNTLSLTPSAVTSLSIAYQGISTSPPGVYNLSFSGGGGASAAGTATIGTYTNDLGVAAVGVVSLNLTNGGSNYTTAPAVTVVGASFSAGPVLNALIASQGAGYTLTPNVFIGSGTSAAASAHVWPFVPKGNTLAVFQGRVWLNGLNTISNQFNILQWTGTGASYGNVGYDDFLAGDASGSLIISDADLVHAITALRALNNYLFIMGDQSVKQIGNISLNNAADVTLFTILTLSSDEGTIFPQSCLSFNRIAMFVNQDGIYGVFGSSVQKLSSDLDGLWNNIILSSIPNQGAVFDLNSIHYAAWSLNYADPVLGNRQILVAFDGKRWQVWGQATGLSDSIVVAPSLASEKLTLYSLGGNNMWQLLSRVGAPVPFTIQTALTHHGNAVQGKRVVRGGFTGVAGAANVPATVSFDTEKGIGTALTFTIPDVTALPQLTGGAYDNSNPQKPVNAAGIYLGATISATAFLAQISNIVIEFQDTALWKGA